MLTQPNIAQQLKHAGRRTVALAGALVLALAVPAAYQAGYPPAAQAVFVALGGLAFVAAIFADEEAAFVSARSGPTLALGGLGLLGVLSAAWTLIGPVDSLRWGLVVVAYGALTVAAAVFARQSRGVLIIASAVAVLAAAEAALGLGAAALRELPYAERIGGSWRAGGTFEYSAGLALLQVMALPALLSFMARGRPVVAGAAAAAGALAAGTIVTSESRIELAMAMVICAAAVLWPARTAGRSRREAIAAIVVLVVAGVAVRAALGGYVPPHQIGGSTRRLLELVATAVGCGLVWPWWRAAVRRLRWSISSRPRRGLLALGALGLAVLAFLVSTAPLHGRGIEPSAGLLHGRSGQWRAAWRSFADRPVLGAGAGGYLAASVTYQGRAPVRYAHDLPLEAGAELGVGGIAITVVLYASVGVLLWRSRRARGAWLVGPGVAAFLVANLVDWEWHLPLSSAIWAVQLGAVMALVSAGPEPPRPVPASERARPRARAPARAAGR